MAAYSREFTHFSPIHINACLINCRILYASWLEGDFLMQRADLRAITLRCCRPLQSLKP